MKNNIDLNSLGGGKGFLILVSLISAMGGFLFGYETVVIAGTIAPIKVQFEFSSMMEGWFVSSGLVGCMAGVLLAGAASDKFGRKSVLMASGLMLGVASIGCALASDGLWLVIYRVVGGAGVGLASIVSPLYISEVAPANLRGRLVSVFQLAIAIGILAAMLMNGWLLEYSLLVTDYQQNSFWSWMLIEEVWRGMFFMQLIPSVVFAALVLVVPDSPRWLISKGRKEEALHALCRLRGSEGMALVEMTEVEAATSEVKPPLSQLFGPGLRTALFLGVFLAVFSELSGITVVMYYGPIILSGLGMSTMDSLAGHASIGAVLAVCTLFSVWLVDKIGRRKLLMFGVAGAFFSFLSIGALLSLGISNAMLFLLLICGFVAFFACSIGPIKWIVISEIFPTGIRARAMSLATIALWATDVLINFFFPLIRDGIGLSFLFYICAVFLLIQFLVVWQIMPETKGMSLEEIESIWIDPRHREIPR